jgi:hypothetical protein
MRTVLPSAGLRTCKSTFVSCMALISRMWKVCFQAARTGAGRRIVEGRLLNGKRVATDGIPHARCWPRLLTPFPLFSRRYFYVLYSLSGCHV